MIRGKWEPFIVWVLKGNTVRFGEIQNEFPAFTRRVLTRQLRDLEQDGLISRTVYSEIPPRIEYALTEKGESIVPILDH